MNTFNKQLVRSFADAGNKNDLDAFDSILAKDFQRHCEATPEVIVGCCEDFKQFYIETAKTFPDQKMTLEKLVAEGDLVAFWGTFPALRKDQWGRSLQPAKKWCQIVPGYSGSKATGSLDSGSPGTIYQDSHSLGLFLHLNQNSE